MGCSITMHECRPFSERVDGNATCISGITPQSGWSPARTFNTRRLAMPRPIIRICSTRAKRWNRCGGAPRAHCFGGSEASGCHKTTRSPRRKPSWSSLPWPSPERASICMIDSKSSSSLHDIHRHRSSLSTASQLRVMSISHVNLTFFCAADPPPALRTPCSAQRKAFCEQRSRFSSSRSAAWSLPVIPPPRAPNAARGSATSAPEPSDPRSEENIDSVCDSSSEPPAQDSVRDS